MQIDIVNQSLLLTIVQSPMLHARFLNTLSLMELLGAQKLSRFIVRSRPSTFLLEHVAEEYRHAFFLRRLARKLANNLVDDFTKSSVFCMRLSMRYINNLDRQILVTLKDHGYQKHDRRIYLTYLLTTLAIERRALPFYTSYQAILDHERIPISVKSIISEEEDHLRHINTHVEQEQLSCELIDDCVMLESINYDAWLNALALSIRD